jgi:hypothetical protein
MLNDGVPYSSIIKTLGQHGHKLNQANLSRWHSGGFNDWLRHQAWLDEMRTRLDFASDIVNQPNADLLDQASVRIALTRMYTLLTQFDPVVLQPKIAETPGAYARILNALCNLASSAIKIQRNRELHTRSTFARAISGPSSRLPVLDHSGAAPHKTEPAVPVTS